MTCGMVLKGKRLTDDRVFIITVVRGMILQNLLVVVGIALFGTKISNPYSEQVV